MLEMIKKLFPLCSVSGCESAISQELTLEILPYCGDIRIDALGNLIARKKGVNANGNPPLLFVVPLDTPGFYAQPHDGKVYLLPAVRMDTSDWNGIKADFFEHGTFDVKTDLKDSDRAENYYINSDAMPLGAPGRIKGEIEITEKSIVCPNAGVLARIAIAAKLITQELPRSVDFLFCAKSFGKIDLSYRVARNLGSERAVLLAAAEPEESKIGIIVRDGKHFSDPDMIAAAEKIGKKYGAVRQIFSDKITQATELANADVATLSLNLPMKKKNAFAESIRIADLDRLYSFCLEFLS